MTEQATLTGPADILADDAPAHPSTLPGVLRSPMAQTHNASPLTSLHMLVCIAFHYNEARLTYLAQVLQGLNAFPCDVRICVLTNTTVEAEARQLQQTVQQTSRFPAPRVLHVSNLMHPFLLPWAHKQVMKEEYERDATLTHFVYLEDDMALTPANMEYWIESRELLAGTPFYPTLVRVEWNETTRQWHSTDLLQPTSLARAPFIEVQGCEFVNMTAPYQGMTIYDRALLAEHIASPSFRMSEYANLARMVAIQNGQPGYFDARERATYGQTYMSVPQGFHSRNLLRVSRKFRQTDFRAWIHHLPNNYTNNPAADSGKIAMGQALVD
ncbi:MAG: hypothetical protein QM742_04065 [Aquabacterium sp.]